MQAATEAALGRHRQRLWLALALVAVAAGASLTARRRPPPPSPRIGRPKPAAPATPRAATEPVRIGWLPPPVARFAPLFEHMGRRHGLDAELLAVVALVESGGFSRAVSSSGARGLMQIMPRTGRIIAEERGISDHDDDRLFDPETNVDFGAYYLAQQLRAFATADAAESVELAAAAYNGGPTTLRRHLTARAQLSAQTERYRTWVAGMYGDRRSVTSTTFEAWLDAGGDRLVRLGQVEMEAARLELGP